MLRPDILLVDDHELAALNRVRVANKQNIIGYLQVENWLKTHKQSEQFPSWMPTHDDIYSVKAQRERGGRDEEI